MDVRGISIFNFGKDFVSATLGCDGDWDWEGGLWNGPTSVVFYQKKFGVKPVLVLSLLLGSYEP